ncbi:MAG TPA: hypothetical protein VK206_28375 [Anaerolineales bacterium]|nr:hypothetical protein [Anaerolineales bacterium]
MFGEWMTWQENDGWRFRLPTIQEAESFPLKPFKQSPLGYWLNEAHYFAWIGAVPWDAGRINSLAKDLAREFAALREIGYERDLIRARSNYFHLEDRSASNEDRQSRDRNDAENDEKALAQARLRTESRADALERSRVRAFNRAQVLDLDLVFTRGRALDLGLAFVSVDPINRADVLARDISRARELVFDHAYTPNEVFDNALDVFIDLFTLQERIAGRSPAFEGIRLVKELIR